MQTTIARQTSEGENEAAPATTGTAFARTAIPIQLPFKPRTNGVNGTYGALGDKGLIEALMNSKVFQDYERAFTEATGLPVALRPVESWQLPHHGKRNEGPFCALMSEKSRACASCLQT